MPRLIKGNELPDCTKREALNACIYRWTFENYGSAARVQPVPYEKCVTDDEAMQLALRARGFYKAHHADKMLSEAIQRPVHGGYLPLARSYARRAIRKLRGLDDAFGLDKQQ